MKIITFYHHFSLPSYFSLFLINRLGCKSAISSSEVFIKVGSSTSKKKLFYLLQWNLFKHDEKFFLFHLKNSFPSQDITITIKILLNMLRSKSNQTINVRQLTEYNKINIFFFNDHAENEAGRQVPDFFSYFKRGLYETRSSGLQFSFNIFW